MRYFLEIAYRGTNYHGWQIQPNARSVQETINTALSTIINQPIYCVGCGRTDTGVHASQFFLHFDAPEILPLHFVARLNKFLPKDIAIKRLIDQLPEQAHTRFDATYRAYDYYMHFQKNPFLQEHSLYYPYAKLDHVVMQEVARLLLNYEDFVMFCKTGSDTKTTLCQLFKTELVYNKTDRKLRFHIAANRFLRGMVRRIMGLLLSVGRGKIGFEEVKTVMDTKGKFSINLSVEPQGLFLSEVRYPYLK